ncbi:MAG: XRE family transcriptional regulator [Chitinophagales bacterium]
MTKNGIVNANIKFIRKQKGLTQQGFADLISIKRSSLGAYEEGRAKPSYDTIRSISRIFNISLDKLLNDDLAKIADLSVFGGDNAKQNQTTRQGRKGINQTPDISGNKLRVLSITVDEDDRQNIELVQGTKAAASYLKGYGDPAYIKTLPKFRLPFLPQDTTYRAFEIEGDSMLPIKPGTIIIGEYIEDWGNIKDGQTCIVVSQSEGVVYKRVSNRIPKDQTLTLRSDNPIYPPFSVNVNNISEIWRAKAFISTNFPENEVSLETLASTVYKLQEEILELKKDKNKRIIN